MNAAPNPSVPESAPLPPQANGGRWWLALALVAVIAAVAICSWLFA